MKSQLTLCVGWTLLLLINEPRLAISYLRLILAFYLMQVVQKRTNNELLH
jgi:hypothetical protein